MQPLLALQFAPPKFSCFNVPSSFLFMGFQTHIYISCARSFEHLIHICTTSTWNIIESANPRVKQGVVVVSAQVPTTRENLDLLLTSHNCTILATQQQRLTNSLLPHIDNLQTHVVVNHDPLQELILVVGEGLRVD